MMVLERIFQKIRKYRQSAGSLSRYKHHHNTSCEGFFCYVLDGYVCVVAGVCL